MAENFGTRRMELMHNPVEQFQITTVSLPAKEQPAWPYVILS